MDQDQLKRFVEIDSAYWSWVDKNCPFEKYREDEKRKKWRDENPFPFEGKNWKRSASPVKSNTGKTIVDWRVRFLADDGEVISNSSLISPNRRNDPKRNWGLGRD